SMLALPRCRYTRVSSLFLAPTPPPSTSPLSLHDALPIFATAAALRELNIPVRTVIAVQGTQKGSPAHGRLQVGDEIVSVDGDVRSEEHTSELQSRENLVCRLLLEKKKKE